MEAEFSDHFELQADHELIEEGWGNSWDIASVVASEGCNANASSSSFLQDGSDPSWVCKGREDKKSSTHSVKCKDEYTFLQSTPVERMALDCHKAGMQGLDKDKINQIIMDASKGSEFYENEKRKEVKVKGKIEVMKRDLGKFSHADRSRAFREADVVVEGLTSNVDLSRTLVHIDMDAFFAAVEMRENPALKDIPMAVGGSSMLSTSNYVARRFGVRAGMPGFIAKKLCPELVIIQPHYDKYMEVSKQVRAVVAHYDPNFLAFSFDEAYLDITQYMAENAAKYIAMIEEAGDLSVRTKSVAECIVNELRGRIFEATGLTASAGIGPNMMLSKICSDMNKPNGQFFLPPDKVVIKTFIDALPIRNVCGIGKVSEQVLKAFDIHHCKDLYTHRDILYLLFSKSSFGYFMRIAHGISTNSLEHEDRKSMSIERTFADCCDADELVRICFDLCKKLEDDLKKEDLQGTNLTLKIKLASFEVKTRSKSLKKPVSCGDDLFAVARAMLMKELNSTSCKPLTLRLMGIRISDFVAKGKMSQKDILSFFSKQDPRVNMDQWDCRFDGSACSSALVGECTESDCDKIERTPTDVVSSSRNPSTLQDNVKCPVCGSVLPNNLALVNAHVDECLTKKAIREIVRDQDCTQPNLSRETPCASRESPSKSGKYKRKSRDDAQSPASKKTTLHNFWSEKT